MDLNKLDRIHVNFIIGLGRSGTTLLVVLLNQNPNCIATPEIHHFIHFYKKYKKIDCVSQELIDDYKDYVNRFFNYKKNPLIGPPNDSLINSLEIGQNITYTQLTKLIYLGLFGQKGVSDSINVIVDKNPYYTLQIQKLMEIFPDAKLLALIRDPRGYVLSNMQSRKISVFKKDISYHAYVWKMFMRKIIEAKQKYGANINIVKYEDIALHKEKTIKSIFDFFGLHYSENIFNFQEDIKEKIKNIRQDERNYERMLKKLKDLSVPINAERVYAWKTDLNGYEIKKIDYLAGTIGYEFEYISETHITLFEKINILSTSSISYLKAKVFEWLKFSELHVYHNYKISNAKN